MSVSASLLRSALTAALAGFLFGFDTVVISGAEQRIQSLWVLSDLAHGVAVSMALWGTVVGALTGAWPADRFGRRITLTCIGVLYFVSALWSALAHGPWDFMLARFVGGIGIGVSTVVAPLYISEIAPAAWRGRLTGLFQFNIVLGILIAYLSNAWLKGIGAADWRWMLGIAAAPALIYTLLCLGIPESPRWMTVFRRRAEAATAILRRIDPRLSQSDAQAQVASYASAEMPQPGNLLRLWHAGLAAPVRMAFLIAFFNQLSGINAVLYFAPRIFQLTGLGTRTAMLQSIGIGITNLLFTLLGLQFIDRLGRRSLMLIGSIGYIVSLGACAWAFLSAHLLIVPWCIFAFIAAHAIGQGAVIWVFIAEIFPNAFRAAGQSFGSATHWVFAALVTLVFPWLVARIAPGQVFLIFAGLMVLQLIWVLWRMPETRGVPLEQLQRSLGTARRV
jgi:sugar porter (SP) family MFS transporter